MAELTGVLQADFSEFFTAVTKADAQLRGLQTTTGTTEKALSRMADETITVSRETGSLTEQYRHFDGILSSAGINIGRQVRAFDELKEAAKGGGEGLSLFAKAGLVASAAMAGWELGKMIDGWTGLSTAIGDTIAELLGWTDAAGGAGSATDAMRRASVIAGREITTFAEAHKILEENVKKLHPPLKAKTEAVKEDTEAMRAAKVVQDAANAAQEKFVALQSQMFGADLIAQAHEYAKALGDISNVSILLPDQMTKLNQTFQAAAEHLVRIGGAGSDVHQEFMRLATATSSLDDLLDALPKVSIDWMDAANEINAANASIVTSTADVAEAVQGTADETTKATAANHALAASFTVVTKSAKEWQAQAIALRADADRMEKSGGGLSTTMWQSQYIENLRTDAANAMTRAGRQSQLDAQVAGIGAPWGGGGGWTVNVNAQQGINGDAIASELVSGMRRRGISPGGL